MGCCKCQEHEWEDPQEPVYTDEEGKEYCVFHAPKEHKGIGGEEFNERVFDRIRAFDLDSLDFYDFRGTVFPGDISFSHYNDSLPLPAILFSFCEFCGAAVFNSATFINPVSFDNAIFYERADFGRCTFNDEAVFDNAVFLKDIRCTSAIFNGHTSFNATKLYEHIYFISAEFNSFISFSSSIFFDTAFFVSVKFNKLASFCKTIFNDEACFRHGTFNRITFEDINAKKGVDFKSLEAVACELRFEDLDLYRYDFMRTDMTNIHFVRCCWPVEDRRYRIAAEDKPGKLEEVKDFYQAMKRKYKQEHNEAEVSQWHLAEKEVELAILARDKRVNFTRIALWLYRLSSRFGEDAARAGVVLGWMVVSVGLLLVFGGIADGQATVRIETWPWTWTWSWSMLEKIGILLKTLLLNLLLVTPDSIPFKPVHELAGAAVLLLTRLLIPIQAALFAFALRNRFRR